MHLRLISARNLIHTVRSRGCRFRVVATDGNPVPAGATLPEDAVRLGPSERVDLELHSSGAGAVFEFGVEHQMASDLAATLH